MLQRINSAHGSDTRNTLNRAIDAVNQQGKSIQDLIADGQLTPQQYAQLITYVNGNIKHGEVTVYDIDKNKGKFDQTFMSDQFLSQMAGNTPINSTPPDGGVTEPKLADNAATRRKRTSLGEQGLVSGAHPAEVNFNELKIKFSHGTTHYIMHSGNYYEIPSETVINLTSSNGISGIWYNVLTGEFKELRYWGRYDSLTENDVLLGFVYLNSSNTLNAEMFGNYFYVGDDTKNEATGFIISSIKANFDFNQNQIQFPQHAHSYLFSDGKRYQIQAGTVADFSDYVNESIFKIMYDTISREIYFATQYRRTSNLDITLGAVITSSKEIKFNGEYTVDSQEALAPGVGEVKFIGSSNVDINTNDRTVTFPNPTSLLYVHGTEYTLSNENKVVQLPDNHNIFQIRFNVATGELRQTRSNTALPNEYVVMVVKLSNPVQVAFNGAYTIDGETPGSVSDIEHNLEDMIWSWWIYPLATRFKGMRDKTYIGYTDSVGNSGVGSYDNETGQRLKMPLKSERIDDHNAAAVDVMDDGRIIAAYSTGHNTDGNIHIRVSTDIESVEKFDPPTTVGSEGRITYAHLFKGGGKWWLFFRGPGGPEGDECSYTSSEDGKNWSEIHTLIEYSQVIYPKIQYTTDPNILRFVITTNAMSGEKHFRLAFFNMTTGNLELEDGTILGDERVLRGQIPIIVPRTQGMSQRLLDVAVTDRNETLIAYSMFSDNIPNAPDIDYRVSRWHNEDLETAVLTDGGEPFYQGSNYVGGMAFGYDSNEVYLSREDNGIWHIEKWETSDFAEWSHSETLHTSQPGYVAIRPVLEKNGDKILWHEGKYNPDSYRDYYTDTKFRKIRNLG